MTGTDAEIIRTIRRELGKRPVDATRVDIQVVGGRVTIGGTLGFKREVLNVSLEAEMEIVQKVVTRDRLVREFTNQLNYARRHDTEEETNARGRSRRG